MDVDQCPRCGLPENWTLKLRVRLVLVGFTFCFFIGLIFGWVAL